MRFAEDLRPHVERLGTAEAARVCGVTPRAVQLWVRGDGNPNAATQAGAILLLSRAKPKKERPTSR